MDLFDVIRSCVRRWYVFLPLVLVTGWFAYNYYHSVQPVYYSSAVVGIAPPNSRLDQAELGVPVPRNGLLDVGGLAFVANLAVLHLREPAVIAQVVEAGGQANYGVRMFPTDSGTPQLPLIMVEANELDPASAKKTVELVAAQADPALRLLQQQAQVPDDQMVTALPVSTATEPAGAAPSRTRSTVAIFVAGTGGAILISLAIDVLIMSLKSRRRNVREEQLQRFDPPGFDGSDIKRAEDALASPRAFSDRVASPSAGIPRAR